ncbi:hypothetical protein CVT26_002127 [Gymnopilus dilepis]|uniref:DNA polymerase n=1 Tax=Gymnopilus dilepis TaxID=231916 RepID=A0A409VEI3_9AGAR|nr:hypothetical protein CVT26_002127 [Gymnopilus dilepis]
MTSTASHHPSGKTPPQLQVRINQIDYVLATPGDLDNASLPRVPVLRIFGSSSAGKTACVHIHQVYPYLFVQYLGKLDPVHVKGYISRLFRSLNHAIALSLKRNPQSSKSQFVRAILLVKGVDFYGFHSTYTPFLKILLADPGHITRVASILQSGSVMATRFTVYETHLSFVLQFLCDFGLYGCGVIELEEVLERCSEEREGISSTSGLDLGLSSYVRESRLPLEFDAIAPCIMNRHRLQPRNLHHHLQLSVPEPSSEPLVLGVRELWEDERNQRQALGLNPSPELPKDPSESSRGAGGDWVAESRWWDELTKRLRADADQPQPTSSDSEQDWERFVMTTFESIQALWDKKYRTWKPSKPEHGPAVEPATSTSENHPHDYVWDDHDHSDVKDMASQVDVDISLLAYQDSEQLDRQDGQETDKEGIRDFFQAEENDEDPEDGFFDLEPDPPSPRLFDPQGRVSPTPSNGDVLLTRMDDPPHLEDEMRQENASAMPQNASTGVDAMERASAIAARAVQLSKVFNTCKSANSNQYVYSSEPPTVLELEHELHQLGLPSRVYRTPFYSRDIDVPEHSKEFAGLTYRLKGEGITSLEEWPTQAFDMVPSGQSCLNPVGVGGWEYASHPPSVKEVRIQLPFLRRDKYLQKKSRSQIEGPTQVNIYGYTTSPAADTSTFRESAKLTILSVEVFSPARGDILSDPSSDPIIAIFYACHISGTEITNSCVLTIKNSNIRRDRMRQVKMETFDTELDMLNRFIDLVIELDPDVLTGWEVQLNSWGFLNARSDTYGLALTDLISRAPPRSSGVQDIDQWGYRKTSTFKVAGRHVLNLWRVMRSERTLTIYSFENVVFEVLRRRVPKYSHKTLTEWYLSPVPLHTSMLLQYLSMRVVTNLELLEETETITKTAEFARVFGVDFFSVLSRGSQFKVESFMFRIAKPESFVLISPSKIQVGKQNAAECMPLIMEPASAFYTSPLLVLDFQSLYPSIMIAYNYCYSTCLGRVTEFQGRYKFGVVENLDISYDVLHKLQDHITIAPNGIMYVKPGVRKGLLGRMLTELLDTRVMVKQAMKRPGQDKARKRILDARQLGLKYIANVTYGYTSATFSGRMPAVEIADSIVQSGRETLEKAIDVIDSTAKWGARVVYGDTDSVFVYLPGKSKEEAFAIGNEIAETITALNPAPIKLKFEKVYLPSVLLAKKRYVGFKYEGIDETTPVFDAKGIETVRRDGVLAQRKMVENCLKILFRTQDLSEVKDYCCRSWTKLLDNKAPVQDFIFAKEVRMGTYSDKGPPPPGVVVAARRMVNDPNDEPQYGDRIPYVIVQSSDSGRLVDRVMDPLEFMEDSQLRLDALYYITRVLIPPLERIFNLVGANVRQWFEEMPKTLMPELVSPRKSKMIQASQSDDRINIDEHFLSTQCLSCGEPAAQSLCDECCLSKEDTIASLGLRIKTREERLVNAHRVCCSCTGAPTSDGIQCISIDCQWFYTRRKAEAALELVPTFVDLIEELQMIASEGTSLSGEIDEVGDMSDVAEELSYDSDTCFSDSEDQPHILE